MMSHSSAFPANPANAPSPRFFGCIGIKPGARVLDVGCGSGDLSRFLAQLVGAAGEVIAIDRSTQAIDDGRKFTRATTDAPIGHHAVDLSGNLPDLGTFDAIVGRRVLMYLPDPQGR